MQQYYYVGSDNKSYGPIYPTEFRTYGLTADSLVCPVGGSSWVPLRSIPGLSDYLQGPSQSYSQPQQQYRQQQYQEDTSDELPPNSYMVWAILVTIFCCLPFGIVAIIKAANVNSLWYSGRRDEARLSSDDAKKWCIYSAVASVISFFLAFTFSAVTSCSMLGLMV